MKGVKKNTNLKLWKISEEELETCANNTNKSFEQISETAKISGGSFQVNKHEKAVRCRFSNETHANDPMLKKKCPEHDEKDVWKISEEQKRCYVAKDGTYFGPFPLSIWACPKCHVLLFI